MGQDKRKNRTSIIIHTIVIVVSVLLFLFTAYNIYKLSILNKDISKLNNTLTKSQKDLNYEKENQKLILNELEHLNNIDEEINKKREEVFNLAKELEQKILQNETQYKIAYLTLLFFLLIV